MFGVSSLFPLLAASFAAWRFLKLEQRLPSEVERSKLINGSFLIFVTINFILLGILVLDGFLSEGGKLLGNGSLIMILGGVSAIAFLITYFMIRWAYGGLLNKQAAKLIKQDTTFD